MKLKTKVVSVLNENKGIYEDKVIEIRPTRTERRFFENKGEYRDVEVELTDAEIEALPKKKAAAKKKASKKK